MKILLSIITILNFTTVGLSQIGFNTNSPKAFLHVLDSAVVFSSPGAVPASPNPIRVTGEGKKLIWYADRGAFRAGYVSGSQWDNSFLANYSFATGYNTRATGESSFAIGSNTTASGIESVAMGNGSTAAGIRSMTFNGYATGYGAISLGTGSQASNDDALALGPSSISSGLASVAIGPSIATGAFAIAIGLQNKASANFSTAIGKNARAINQGAMVLGDASASFSSDSVYSSANNQMTMRFVAGYRLFTALNLTNGVQLAAGGGSWSSISDKQKKENIQSIHSDIILQKLSAIPVAIWNYKTQPASQKHIGPMAQDFYAAFGLDGLGNDTTINSLDFDGVNMAAIQALDKRTNLLKDEIKTLSKEIADKNYMIEILQQNQLLMQKQIALLQDKLISIEKGK